MYVLKQVDTQKIYLFQFKEILQFYLFILFLLIRHSNGIRAYTIQCKHVQRQENIYLHKSNLRANNNSTINKTK